MPNTPNTTVPIRALWFSDQSWDYAPQNPYDADARYAGGILPTSITLITWNVDYNTPNVAERLTAALDYLQFHAFPEYKGNQPPRCMILLQEIALQAFDVLLAHPWVQAWFMVVPGSPEEGWPRDAWYGTATLVARSVPLAESKCVHFGESYMQRNALVTDVLLGGAEPLPRVLRVVNTHLESLPEGTKRREVQLSTIAELLREEETETEGEGETARVGGIVGGDMNAITQSDVVLADQNGLLDAWEERGRWDVGVAAASSDALPEEEEGTTWGYQPPCMFPPGRLDKILYTEGDAFDVKGIRIVAKGLKMPGYNGWVSDHYGLSCQVEARGAGL